MNTCTQITALDLKHGTFKYSTRSTARWASGGCRLGHRRGNGSLLTRDRYLIGGFSPVSNTVGFSSAYIFPSVLGFGSRSSLRRKSKRCLLPGGRAIPASLAQIGAFCRSCIFVCHTPREREKRGGKGAAFRTPLLAPMAIGLSRHAWI